MKSWRRWMGAVAWLAATVLLVVLAMRVDVSRVAAALARAQLAWVVLAVAAHAAIQPLSTMEWRLLLPSATPVPYRRLLRVFSLTSIANNATPAVVGHVGIVVLVSAEAGVGTGAALSMFTLDQLCVGIVKLAVISTAARLAPLPAWMASGASALSFALVALLILLVGASLRRDDVLRLAERWEGRAGTNRMLAAVASALSAWSKGLDALRSPRRFGLALGFSVLVRLTEFTAILAVQLAFGLTPSLTTGVVALAATALASLVPLVPGNIGVYEGSVFAAYRLMGVPDDVALSIAAVQHVSQLLPAVGIGYGVLTYERFSARTAAQRP